MSKEDSIFKSLEIIENRIEEKLTVENIAESVYFSKNHYQRLFREVVGESVMEYVTKRKLTLAGRALYETNSTVLDIAIDYGFDSREGFTRSFKAYMGVTPSEYRKYGLTAINKTSVKERPIMTYSKITDEIIRELNDFIAKAKATAEAARKCGATVSLPQPFAGHFWNGIADQTDDYANKLKTMLQRVSNIADHPDEITSRFSILKAVEDIAFTSNVMAFHVGITVARSLPEYLPFQKPLADEYVELARVSDIKAGKIARFLNELSCLIVEDLRKEATEKIQSAIQAGKDAAGNVNGYDYIRDEIMNRVNKLSLSPIDEITVSLLDDILYELFIIQLSIDTDILRSSGKDEKMFDGVLAFRDKLREACDFFSILIKPEINPIAESTADKRFSDIAFQGSIMLFYTRGEIEKVSNLINDKQKTELGTICDEIDGFIQIALNAKDDSAYQIISDQTFAIHNNITLIAEALGMYGGALQFIANELGKFSDCVKRLGE